MGASRKGNQTDFRAPDGAAEEFAAAVEAATGEEFGSPWNDPMGGTDILEALRELLLTARPDRGLDVLVRSSIMEKLLPEVAAMVGFGEGIRHKDVWAHTKKVVLKTSPKPILRFAALFHDIGKVPTRRFESGGQVTFIGHPEVGARMFDNVAKRLSFPREFSESVRFLIASHLRASAYDGSWTDSAVRRFAKDMGDALPDLLELSRADITSKYEEKVRRGIEFIDALAERVAALKEEDAKPKPLPKGLGTAIIEHFRIAPGPGLGRLMKKLMVAVEQGELGIQEPFDHYIDFLKRNPTLLEDAQKGDPFEQTRSI